MKGGPRTLKAAKAKLTRKQKLVEKADKEVSELEEALRAAHWVSAQVALKAAKCKKRVAEENCEQAEFELEVIKRKTNIEEIFWRFPHIGCKILEELDNQSLVKCYEVNKWWKKYVGGQKTVFIRKIQKNIGVSNVATAKKLEKESFEKLEELAEYSELLCEPDEPDSQILFRLIGEFDQNPNDLYLFNLIIDNTKDPETLNPAYSDPNSTNTVLHIAASNNYLEAYKMIMNKIKDKNPSNIIGCTPLHFAAKEGHFRICELILNNVEDVNPRIKQGTYNYRGETPLDWARPHKDVYKLIETAISKQNENVSNSSKRRRLQ